jgi:hypothetical protein
MVKPGQLGNFLDSLEFSVSVTSTFKSYLIIVMPFVTALAIVKASGFV